MGITVKSTGIGIPREVWDIKAMRELTNNAVTTVKTRTFGKHKDIHDHDFQAYSTTPIAIHSQSSTGKRLKPKGGDPLYHQDWFDDIDAASMNPFRLYAWTEGQDIRRKATSKKTGKARNIQRRIVGRRYEGGYSEYKAESRKGSDVDLTLSGKLQRSIRAKKVRRLESIIAMTGESAVYGTYVNRKRRFMELSPKDRKRTDTQMGPIIRRAIDRHRERAKAKTQ